MIGLNETPCPSCGSAYGDSCGCDPWRDSPIPDDIPAMDTKSCHLCGHVYPIWHDHARHCPAAAVIQYCDFCDGPPCADGVVHRSNCPNHAWPYTCCEYAELTIKGLGPQELTCALPRGHKGPHREAGVIGWNHSGDYTRSTPMVLEWGPA